MRADDPAARLRSQLLRRQRIGPACTRVALRSLLPRRHPPPRTIAHLSCSRPHPYRCQYLQHVRRAPIARAEPFFSTLMPMLVGWRYGGTVVLVQEDSYSSSDRW